MPLLTIRLPRNATLAVALRTLGLAERDVDIAFGLIAVDPVEGLFALRVTESAATRLTNGNHQVEIFADPPIEPTP
ncbi:hypothetical protein [Nocardia sp. NPDC052566]|uniref:hypothetical protein n=1 Tax=Nocardia sp. NPDC052566 TaxID=3364330 RepID=UPI0037CBA047